MDQPYYIYALVAAVIILIIALVIVNNKKKNHAKTILPFEINELIKVLGGKDNIIEYQNSLSKITLKLKDNSLVDLDAIKQLGASGIVETSDGFTFIFGSISEMIAAEMTSKLK